MPLVLYSAYMAYPGGGSASGASIDVHLRGANQPSPMFSDSAATSPLSSPLTADPFGQIMFYAAPGVYVAALAGEEFPVGIDYTYTDPVYPDVWVHEQVTAAATWTVEHHFGSMPAVQVVTGGTDVVEAQVTHPDSETTVIMFGTAVSGVAHLRR
jgi:hypothetical protein